MEIHLNSRIVTYEQVSKAVTLIAIIVEPIKRIWSIAIPLVQSRSTPLPQNSSMKHCEFY